MEYHHHHRPMEGNEGRHWQNHDHVEFHHTSESYEFIISSQPSHQTISSDVTNTDDESDQDVWHQHYEQEDVWGLLPRPPNLAQLSKDLHAPVCRKEREVLQDFTKYKTHRLSEGKWDIDRDTAQFLAGVASLFADERTAYQPESMLHRMRLEEPVLSVDPELVMIELQQRNMPCLTARDMAPFKLRTDKDESLQWSSQSWKSLTEIKHDISHGRLAVDKATAEFMKGVMTTTQDDHVPPEPRFKV
jgi:hypothetical protein